MAGIGPFGTILSQSGKSFKRNSGPGKVIRSGGGTSKLGIGGAIGSLLSLPRAMFSLAGGLIAGGGLSVAGGLLNLTATGLGIANTAVRLGGQVAGGALGATGGLGGGGQSGNVKKQKQMQMVQSVLNKKGPTGKGGGGTGLGDIKSTLADYGAPEGAMSMLPTGDESGMGMLSGMLHQIAVNTSYLGGIDSKIDALVGLSSISVIDQAQETKGGEGNGGGQDGVIKRSFNSLKDGLSGMSGGIASAGKSLLKGLALGGAFVLFKKFEPQITSGLSNMFENVSGFFNSFGEGNDPSEGIMGYFDSVILPSLVTLAEKFFELIYRAVGLAINKVTGIDLIDTQTASSGQSGDMSVSQQKTQNYSISGKNLGNVTGYGPFMNEGPALKNIELGDYAFGGKGDVTADESADVMSAVRSRLEFMYKAFMNSDGRVRWTEIGRGFIKGRGIDSLNGTFAVEDILYNSKPIIDGFIKDESALSTILPAREMTNLTGDAFIQFEQNLKDLSKNKQIMQADGGFLDAFLFEGANTGTQLSPDEATERFQQILKKNKLLINDGGASLGNNGQIVASIDASNNSQVMNETTVASLTPAYHTDPTQQAINDALRTA